MLLDSSTHAASAVAAGDWAKIKSRDAFGIDRGYSSSRHCWMLCTVSLTEWEGGWCWRWANKRIFEDEGEEEGLSSLCHCCSCFMIDNFLIRKWSLITSWKTDLTAAPGTQFLRWSRIANLNVPARMVLLYSSLACFAPGAEGENPGSLKYGSGTWGQIKLYEILFLQHRKNSRITIIRLWMDTSTWRSVECLGSHEGPDQVPRRERQTLPQL